MKKMTWVAGVVLLAVVVALGIYLYKKGPSQQAGGEILIASIVPLTGPGAEFGGYNREASELVVDDFNGAPGGKIKVRHILQDSKSTPKDGVNALQSILSSERPMAAQVQLSAVAMALAPIAAEKNIPLLTIAGTNGPKTVHKLAFRNYPDPGLTAQETASVFLTNKGGVKVALLRVNDEFGAAVGDAFKKRLKEINVPVVADEMYDKAATDYRAPVTKILGASPATVYIVGIGAPLGRIIVQLRQLGFKGDIIGGPEVAFADVLSTAKEAAEGVRFLDLAFDPQSQEEPTRSFVERYQRRFNRPPTAVSAVVYDGWSLLLHAAERADSTDPNKIVEELMKTNSFSGVNGKLTVNADRDIVYPLTPRVIRGGKTTKYQ
jgi:branched-chain amino acid transport system substrate-binding protein